MFKEGSDLEEMNKKWINVRLVSELEGCKAKLRAGLYVMIKRMQIVFREINVNAGEVDGYDFQEIGEKT
jgi:hypothetical protein